MANPRFAEGERKVMEGVPSTSVPLEDFPPLGSDSVKRAEANQRSAAGASSSSRVDPSSSWSSLFKAEASKLQFMALIVKDGKKMVVISKSIFDQGISFWGDCLLGQLFGHPPKLAVIQSLVDKLWRRKGRIDVIPLDGEGFMFKFEDDATLTWVLEGEPWILVNRLLVLQKWQPGLIIEKLSEEISYLGGFERDSP